MTPLEKHILGLCSQAIAYADKEVFQDILAELQSALAEHSSHTEEATHTYKETGQSPEVEPHT